MGDERDEDLAGAAFGWLSKDRHKWRRLLLGWQSFMSSMMTKDCC
jgi:hypothetical protein